MIKVKYSARRSPSWGAWIEMHNYASVLYNAGVAPPRGERGLKSCQPFSVAGKQRVAPPRGERGLK